MTSIVERLRSIGWSQSIATDEEQLTPENGDAEPASPAAPVPLKVHIKGLSMVGAAMFIVGEMAGSGILALPKAVAGMGWAGIAVIIFCGFTAGFTGVCLARCWLILEERWPEYKTKNRNPFPTIANRAIAPWMQTVVAISMNVQLYGGSIVFLLLCAELTHEILLPYIDLCFCDWILVIGAILCPFTWLGSPQDFAIVAFGAMGGTALSCLLIVIMITQDGIKNGITTDHEAPTFTSACLAFGTILFSYGGACTLPTFQNDMKHKGKFPAAVTLGFIVMLIMYLPGSIGGYLVYGSTLKSNILQNVDKGTMSTIVDALMAFHVFCAFLIVVNPLNLTLEQYFDIPHTFNWKRSTFRTFMVMAIVFTGSSVPKFGKILNLVGASTVSLQTFILPPLFYIFLCKQRNPEWPERNMYVITKTFLIFTVMVGIVGGIVSTYFSLIDLVGPNAFTNPCYVDPNITNSS